METYPYTLHAPNADETFSDEKNDEAVLIGSTASGYPHLNKLFTFDARTFIFEKRHVSQANKETLMAFYEANKEVPFYWTNEQEGEVEYEVAYVSKPRCRLDGQKDEWRIVTELRQTSAETS